MTALDRCQAKSADGDQCGLPVGHRCAHAYGLPLTMAQALAWAEEHRAPLFADNDMGTARDGATDPSKPYEHFERTKIKSAVAERLRERFDAHAIAEGLDETEIAMVSAIAALHAAARAYAVTLRELGQETDFARGVRDRRAITLQGAAVSFDAAETARAAVLSERAKR